MATVPSRHSKFLLGPAGTTTVVIAAAAVALDVAVEYRPLVGVCVVDRMGGGLSELIGDSDDRLGITVFLHAGEERRVVFVAISLLDPC